MCSSDLLHCTLPLQSDILHHHIYPQIHCTVRQLDSNTTLRTHLLKPLTHCQWHRYIHTHTHTHTHIHTHWRTEQQECPDTKSFCSFKTNEKTQLLTQHSPLVTVTTYMMMQCAIFSLQPRHRGSVIFHQCGVIDVSYQNVGRK